MTKTYSELVLNYALYANPTYSDDFQARFSDFNRKRIDENAGFHF
ncbi:hypothetical protein BN874_130011 [Candidatus Contendobacter odensis Run_B_J11]|uniref:Uncharacterized protein n=1 Tax=Candidatus Contendobacter odensis Run_B_J11 TaxID=1400861 RepID=A0A7U7J235_9GAMM|nr:hypothetical protein BN874_130011 [Candidatus Contendobacter odensis Run_B_J11]